MSVEQEIERYIDSQSEPKRSELQQLHELTRAIMPTGKLWFLDGKDENGKVVTNPNIGYGSRITKYADGKTKEFYQIGLSANKTGISVYILGIDDKTFLPRTYGKKIGNATMTGYCIRFKKLKDIHTGVLEEAIRFGIQLRK